MTNYKHLELLGGVDDDLILRAEKSRSTGSARFNLKLISIAAAVTVMAILAIAAAPGLINRPEQPPIVTDEPTDTPIITEQPTTTDSPNTSVLYNPNIVWGNSDVLDSGESMWGNIIIGASLYQSFQTNDAQAIFAVTFTIRVNGDFIYNGRTISDILSDVQSYKNIVQKYENLIASGNEWANEISNDSTLNRYNVFINKYGKDIYEKCFKDGLFVKDEIVAMLKTAQEQARTAENESNAALRAYYDTFPLFGFTETFDSLGIEYMYFDSTDSSDYIPNKEMVFFATKEMLADLSFDDVFDDSDTTAIRFDLYGITASDA